ncbi:ATP-binding protein [Tolypothrix sp. VBCCA 56010]|uniref:ATP-binding protein n=1 Tax=Tolypothrix sp. VBCCA 56010 TaxID=3137731 RepID=UPI003D7D91BC
MAANQFPQKLFQNSLSRFSRAKSSGTGLGLAITKRIVNAHGGELFIQSEVVNGTRVSVKLPVVS